MFKNCESVTMAMRTPISEAASFHAFTPGSVSTVPSGTSNSSTPGSDAATAGWEYTGGIAPASACGLRPPPPSTKAMHTDTPSQAALRVRDGHRAVGMASSGPDLPELRIWVSQHIASPLSARG
ncbi:hypothetical protein GCM10027082_47470 [Comamonas humi]